MFSGGRTNTTWWELKAWEAEGQAPGARVGEAGYTEIMCSVLNKLHRVSTQGAEKVCSSALPMEPDRWSRKFYLEHHSALQPAHPLLWVVLLHSHQGVYYTCGTFSRECGASRMPRAREAREVGEIAGSEQKAWRLGAQEYPQCSSLQVRKVGSREAKV